ncbi:MAG: DNA repair protein RecN [Acidobacteriota bacterium]
MLRYLSITDFALVKSMTLELYPGLTILTGETGAGKSILVDAVGLLLGGRASVEMVREGAAKAVIQGAFDRPDRGRLAAAGFSDLAPGGGDEVSQDEVILVRELTKDGKGRATLDAVLVPVSRLRDLGVLLADLHGQGEQQSLLHPSWQLAYLDGVAGHRDLVSELAERHHALVAAARARDEAAARHAERDRRIAELSYERDELRRAALREGEEAELLDARKLMAGERAAALVANASRGSDRHGQWRSPASSDLLLGRLDRACGQLARFSESAAAPWIAESQDRARDLEANIARLRERLDFDPSERDRVEARLHEIDRLRRKYGRSVPELLARLAGVEREWSDLDGTEDRLRQLEADHGRARDVYAAVAVKVRAGRTRAARRIEKKIGPLLAELSLPGARVVVRVDPKPPGPGADLPVDGAATGFDASGVDDVDLLVSFNPGEVERPLRKVASGGEMSRLMLALKLLADRADGPDTLVFDEVDAGVSGSAAEAIGRKLRELGAKKQVLCITHLPQVASFGHHHIEVEKRVEAGRSVISVRRLGAEDRRQAIARLVAGAEVTEAALSAAADLLSRAATL